jgi:predicted N-acetyltransferase YhbS
MPSTPQPFHIRFGREDERDSIHELTLTAYNQYATIMEPSAWDGLHQALLAALESQGIAETLVAEQDDTLIGSVMLFHAAVDAYGHLALRSEVPELRLLAVAPDGRGQGVGRALVEACVERVGCALVFCEV